MDIINFGNKLKTPTVMCLGYFDAIHKGHKQLILKGKEIAKREGLRLSVFLFIGGKGNSKDIFSIEERLIKLKILGVDTVIFAPLNDSFMSKTKEVFLKELFTLYSVKYTITGKDFRFGYKQEGDYQYLENYANKLGVKSIFLDEVIDKNGLKISSKNIKEYLLKGDIISANELLGDNYFIRGKVIEGKKLGREMGYPTANILLDDNKLLISSGVYLTFVIIKNKILSSLTNVGKQPTVNGNCDVIETYINDFNGDLYGKNLTVYFIEKIREITKFNSVLELKEQLDKDLEVLKW